MNTLLGQATVSVTWWLFRTLDNLSQYEKPRGSSATSQSLAFRNMGIVATGYYYQPLHGAATVCNQKRQRNVIIRPVWGIVKRVMNAAKALKAREKMVFTPYA